MFLDKIYENEISEMFRNKKFFKRSIKCYDSKLKGLSNETTLVLSNTRELDRVLSTE